MDAIARLHEAVSARAGERAARRAIARLWSECGHREGPAEITEMIIQAIEVGCMTALRDVRNVAADDEHERRRLPGE